MQVRLWFRRHGPKTGPSERDGIIQKTGGHCKMNLTELYARAGGTVCATVTDSSPCLFSSDGYCGSPNRLRFARSDSAVQQPLTYLKSLLSDRS